MDKKAIAEIQDMAVQGLVNKGNYGDIQAARFLIGDLPEDIFEVDIQTIWNHDMDSTCSISIHNVREIKESKVCIVDIKSGDTEEEVRYQVFLVLKGWEDTKERRLLYG